MSKEKWEVVAEGEIIATGRRRLDVILQAVAIRDYRATDEEKFLCWVNGTCNRYSMCTVRRVKETPTKAEKLIERMAKLEQRLTAMRDEITVELNK